MTKALGIRYIPRKEGFRSFMHAIPIPIEHLDKPIEHYVFMDRAKLMRPDIYRVDHIWFLAVNEETCVGNWDYCSDFSLENQPQQQGFFKRMFSRG